MELVLDTSALIELEKNEDNEDLNEFLKGHELYVTSLTFSEYLFGAMKSNVQKLELAEERLSKYKVLNTTVNSSKLYAAIAYSLHKEGEKIPDFDVLIASVVKDRDKKLFTFDDHFEKVSGLDKVVW